MQTLLLIAVALFSGLLMTRLFDKFHLPDVTAYLITGVLPAHIQIPVHGISAQRQSGQGTEYLFRS